MSDDAGTVLDLFLKWDVCRIESNMRPPRLLKLMGLSPDCSHVSQTNGDNTVCVDEFTAAISDLGFVFSKQVTDELFRFFDKDDSDAVSLEEIEATLRWGKERKHMRPLLASWRQMTLKLDKSVPIHEQLRQKLLVRGKHPAEMFRRWDENGNGVLDKHELKTLMYEMGGMSLSEGETDKLFASFDKDASGDITFKELNAKLREEVPIEQLMNALAEPAANDTLFEMFEQQWDQDGNGVLDQDEFGQALKALDVHVGSDKALNDLFKMLDEDGSGTVSLKELQNSLRWVRSCEQCEKLRSEAYSFDGTLSIQQQIKRALASNSVRVMVRGGRTRATCHSHPRSHA